MAKGQPDSLTRREQQVLDLLAEGRTNKQISDALFIDVRTAEFHVANVLAKLELDSRAKVPAYVRQEEHVSGTSAASNLPVSLTSFVGRQSDLAAVGRLLERSRLVTLTGPGGIGKTRLAIEAARAHAGLAPDGPWFVDLAPISNPDLVGSVILTTLGLQEERGRATEDTLVASLRQRSYLLLVDNCEHLLPAVTPLFSRIMTACPGIRVLATSRMPIGVDGEVIVHLDGLPVRTESDPRSESTADAVQLFLDRAELVRPGYEAGFNELSEISALCALLDGMPLAIELAAGRMSALSPSELRNRVDHGLSFLKRAGGSALDRHKTMDGAIEWSYSLLEDAGKAVFRRLSVFAGFDVEAAEAVCSFPPVDREQVAGTLFDLVESSLIVARSNGASTRYRLLEPIRQYAFGRMDTGEKADALQRHARHFTDIARLEVPLTGNRRPNWSVRIGADEDNLRAALRWAVDRDLDFEVQLVYSLRRLWLLRGQLAESVAAIAHAVSRTKEETFYRHKMLLQQSEDMTYAGHNEEGVRLAVEALQLAQRLGLARDEQIAWNVLGGAQSGSHLPDAIASFEQAIAMARELGDAHRLALSLANLGIEMIQSQNWKRAGALFDEAFVHFQNVGDILGERYVQTWRGMLALAAGDDSAALRYWGELLEDSPDIRDWESIHRILDGFAQISIRTGDYEDGLLMAGAADGIRVNARVVEITDHPQLGTWIARARAALGQEAADTAWAAGMRMTLTEAVQFALDWARHRTATAAELERST